MTASELAPEGTGYRQKTRFAKFFNLPELMNLFKQTADLNNPARRVGRGFRCSRQDFSHWDALEPRFSPELRFS